MGTLTRIAMMAAACLPVQALASTFPVRLLNLTADHALILVEVPTRHAVYAQHLAAYGPSGAPIDIDLPPPDPTPAALDPQRVYTRDFTIWMRLSTPQPDLIEIDIRGCDYVKGVCFDDRRTRIALEDRS